MPEVAEVAHVRAQLDRNVVGLVIVEAVLPDDPLLFPLLKGATDPHTILSHMTLALVGATVLGTSRHGKYFWINFTNGHSLLMHLGMTGMVHLRDIHLPLIMMENGGDLEVKNKLKTESDATPDKADRQNRTWKYGAHSSPQEWPPRFTKFELKFSNPQSGAVIDFAFTDPRRLARVRLLEGVASDADVYSRSPLAELGADYSKTQHPDTHGALSRQDFYSFLAARQAPIKSLLLNQAHFAGVGNWVLDEILFHAKVHPGQVMARMRDGADFEATVDRLYDALVYVCQESVRVEGDLSKFPGHWLMLHRWGKRRQRGEPQTLADGRALDFVTVGGRTSCYVPSIQIIRSGSEKGVAAKNETKVNHDPHCNVQIKSEHHASTADAELCRQTLLQDDDMIVLTWTLELPQLESKKGRPSLSFGNAGPVRRTRGTRPVATTPLESRHASELESPRRKSRRLEQSRAKLA